MYKINLVEDEQSLNELLSYYLRKEGWEVKSFLTGERAEEALQQPVDLWIMDIMLPDIDGYTLIRKLKSLHPHTAVIFISARDQEIDRVVGLELGSDDYITKPFLPRELVLRVANILQRKAPRTYYSGLVHIKDLNHAYKLDLDRRLITSCEGDIELTSREMDFVLAITDAAGKAFSRQELLDIIWGADYFGSDRVVDDLVRRVRKKLPLLNIETIYGYGYRWCQ